jgi:hypothetical protein
VKGETTTIKETKAERVLHRIIKRNATEMELAQAKVDAIDTTFTIDRDTYRIVDIYLDNLKRLIAIGKLEEIHSLI